MAAEEPEAGFEESIARAPRRPQRLRRCGASIIGAQQTTRFCGVIQDVILTNCTHEGEEEEGILPFERSSLDRERDLGSVLSVIDASTVAAERSWNRGG